MKKIIIAIFAVSSMGLSSCGSLKSLGDYLTEADAANALREALTIGANFGANSLGQRGSFSRDVLLSAVLPQEVQKVVQTLDRLGLTTQLNRFTNTLDNAAVDAVTRSGPIFVDGIRRMSITDAIGIVRNGGTAGTDYLRRTIGDELRSTVAPVMRTALNEYRIADEWDKLVSPVKAVLGNRIGLNLNLDNVLAVIIVNEMFSRIAQQEIAIRTNAQARTSSTLRRVFGREWSTSQIKY
jgi:hypothetical protein